MRINVHAVGRMKAGPERDLAERYFGRLARSGPAVGLEFGGVAETPESRARSAAERRREEAGKLADFAQANTLVLLDERGKDLSSQAFSERLGTLRDTGTKNLVVAIGGADGHDGSLKARAEFTLAFGAQTWPHQMVRIMLAEQLYRAVTILSGHPYHRE